MAILWRISWCLKTAYFPNFGVGGEILILKIPFTPIAAMLVLSNMLLIGVGESNFEARKKGSEFNLSP